MKVLVRLFGGQAEDGVMMTLDLPSVPTTGDIVDTYGDGGVGGVYVVRRRRWFVNAEAPKAPGLGRDARADVIVECDHLAAAAEVAAGDNVVRLPAPGDRAGFNA